jgi:hypothetical protein
MSRADLRGGSGFFLPEIGGFCLNGKGAAAPHDVSASDLPFSTGKPLPEELSVGSASLA